jgi:hypothetical protein
LDGPGAGRSRGDLAALGAAHLGGSPSAAAEILVRPILLTRTNSGAAPCAAQDQAESRRIKPSRLTSAILPGHLTPRSDPPQRKPRHSAALTPQCPRVRN